jgi:hypothetical protein
VRARHGDAAIGPLDRVLVVLLYRTVEMDTCPSAPAFLDDLVQAYHDRGISLTGIYADETHIQGDWSYHSHLDNGQFTVRYVSPGFERAFAARFGAQYADMAKYMLYFACRQHDFLGTHAPKLPSQHVFGPSPEDVARTFRFRRDYYRMLEHSVVALMVDARDKMERLNNRSLESTTIRPGGSSTCDAWAIGGVHETGRPKSTAAVQYTPIRLVERCTSRCCADQFAWNDFLTGGSDDTPEAVTRRNYGAPGPASGALNRSRWRAPGCGAYPARVRPDVAVNKYTALWVTAFRSVGDYERGRSKSCSSIRKTWWRWMKLRELMVVWLRDLITADRLNGMAACWTVSWT